MEITRTSGGVRLGLTYEEMDEAELSFESFEKGDRATERFLSALLAMLRQQGYITAGPSRLDVEVSETEDGMSLNIIQKDILICERVLLFDDPAEFESKLHELCSDVEGSCELWKYGSGYALITKTDETQPDPKQSILSAKLREHGRLLSRRPFDLI